MDGRRFLTADRLYCPPAVGELSSSPAPASITLKEINHYDRLKSMVEEIVDVCNEWVSIIHCEVHGLANTTNESLRTFPAQLRTNT